MKHNINIKFFFTLCAVFFLCISQGIAQKKVVKKSKAVTKVKAVPAVVIQGQMTTEANGRTFDELTTEEQAVKSQINYEPSNVEYTHTKQANLPQIDGNAQEQINTSRQARKDNLPLDGSLIETDFRTLLNPE